MSSVESFHRSAGDVTNWWSDDARTGLGPLTPSCFRASSQGMKSVIVNSSGRPFHGTVRAGSGAIRPAAQL
ncbi:hypothetical protein N7465_006021 [Penicillium sp. CMV-2018d]|nr:hypothetical protein N7465_006021 [Penicillium sp. CMV-2018d]